MSVSIHYRPIADVGRSFNGGTSTSLARLQEVFGNVIRSDDIKALRAMAIAAHDDFYEEVADLVDKIGDIEVWGEY